MAIDPGYARQKRNTIRRLKGKKILHKTITEVGAPVDARINTPTLVPIRFHDGTYAIIWDEKTMRLLTSNNPKVNRAIKSSAKMPGVNYAIGSDVVWLKLYPKKDINHAFVKIYYNEKEDCKDSYHEVTWKEQFARNLRLKESSQATADAA